MRVTPALCGLRGLRPSLFGVRVLYRVYIDEAGDRGMKATSSDYFVVAAVLVADDQDAPSRQHLSELKVRLGRATQDELQFSKLSHIQRRAACVRIAQMPVGAITSVILCKRHLATSHLSTPDGMYLYSIRLLLERVSWFCETASATGALPTFAHVKRFPYQKLGDYRQRLEARNDVEIRWSLFDGHAWRINYPSKIELLQVADNAASAIYHAVQPDEFGEVEAQYAKALRPKLYRRGAARLTSYGLKVFPPPCCDAGGHLGHLDAY